MTTITIPKIKQQFPSLSHKIYSQSNKSDAINYFINFFQTIPENSEFEQKNKAIINFSKNKKIPNFLKHGLIYTGFKLLTPKGYDALLLTQDNNILGHNAYQIHKDNSLHVFSMGIQPKYQRLGLATKMQEQTIEYAREIGIDKIRIGGGGDKKVIGLCKKLEERSSRLGIKSLGDWYFKIN